MDKILHILLVFLFSLTIVSCGTDDGGSSSNTTSTTSTTAVFGTAVFDSSTFSD